MLIINQHVAMHHSLFPWHRILDVEDNDDNDEDDDDDDDDDDDWWQNVAAKATI